MRLWNTSAAPDAFTSGTRARQRKRLVIHACRTALAAGLCWWLSQRLGLHDGYWAPISAIIVLQSNVGATVSASVDRILGTLIGAILGFAFTLYGTLPWNFIAAVLCAVIVCGLFNLRQSSRLAGVTVAIVMLVKTGSHWTLALDRVTNVFLGILVALSCAALVFPDRARLRLRDGLAREFLILGTLFEATLQGFRGTPAADFAHIRALTLDRIQSNNQLLVAARREPAGSFDMREGLGLLTQFGRDLHDALIALEYSVRDSHTDAFAQQLEPELGQLAASTLSGFHYVADCIQHWRFHIPPPGLQLEDDIAALEARMDAVRHTGREFPQAEILRAYAVQLHLKQIARLLRSARIQTDHALNDLPA